MSLNNLIGEGSVFDYIVNTARVRVLVSDTQPDNVEIILFRDIVAQEPNETFTLTLNPLVTPNPREGLFFKDTIQVTIVDSDSKDACFWTINFVTNYVLQLESLEHIPRAFFSHCSVV